MQPGQDWEQVVFKKRPQGPSDQQRRASAAPTAARSSVTGGVAYKIEAAADGDGEKLKTVSKEDRDAIVGGRVAKGWTRDQLAKQCNMDVKILGEIENGKAFENKQQLSLIKRVLGINKK